MTQRKPNAVFYQCGHLICTEDIPQGEDLIVIISMIRLGYCPQCQSGEKPKEKPLTFKDVIALLKKQE